MNRVTAGNWEKRWHPLRREWVVYAAHRNRRPWSFQSTSQKAAPAKSYDSTCYLCPGNKRNSGKYNPQYEDVYVFENDFPVVGFDSPGIDEKVATLKKLLRELPK